MLSFYFEDGAARTLLPSLQAAAARLGMQLVEQTDLTHGANLHFLSSTTTWTGKTGLTIAYGDGWSEALVKKHNVRAWLPKDITTEVLHMLLTWASESRECQQVKPLRHELGNLVVIYMARMSKLRAGGVDNEQMEKLEALHQRLDELYRNFDQVKIP